MRRKRNWVDADQAVRTAIDERPWKAHRPGESFDYSEFQRHFPGMPPEAYFLRRYATLRDSLRAFRVEKGMGPAARPQLRGAADATLKELGSDPPNYHAARKAVRQWQGSIPEESQIQDLARRIAEGIENLIAAYEDPKHFFSEIAPREFPAYFDGYLANEMLAALANLAKAGSPPSAIDARFPSRIGLVISA